MPSSARHSLPSPASSAVPDVPVDIKALADAVDLKLPYVSVSTPPHLTGLIWRNPNTGLTMMSDGSAWQPVTAVTWVGYTPVWTMDVGNGTKTGYYTRSGTEVTVNAAMLASAGVSLGAGGITVSLPFTAATRTNHIWHGQGVFITSGGHSILHVEVLPGASVAQIFAVHTGNHTLASPGVLGYGFVAGDRMSVQFTYECV